MSHSIDHLRHLLSSQKLNLYYVRCRVSVCMLALHPPANELQATQTSSMHAHKNTLRISTSAGKYPTNLTLLFFPTRWPKCVCVWVSMNIFVRVKCARVRIIFPQWFNVVCLFFSSTNCYSFSDTIQYAFAAHAFALPTHKRTTQTTTFEQKKANWCETHRDQ